ncbi:hypothetical protein [Paenibacillus lutimineralis]|uniref:Uncharacterized protein n=1 Tax=Paenibacillus lutimineralis TaxID=2707005 RepID=A0A3S9UVH3_9BACL|nr:hypothetical protein [Paenibacillus lutimineralis]AZS14332.1 hypothetical protein EI981_07580 [Paenibacillus lutimineralis]
MNHSTSIDECRDNMNKLLTIQERSPIQAKCMIKMQQLAQIHMNSAARMMHPTSAYVCILFSDRALEYMLKALYMEENNYMFPPPSFTLQDVIHLTAQDSVPDLDRVMFMHTIHFLAGCNDVSFLRLMRSSQLQKILNQVDEVLLHLSNRIASHPSESYRSIFPN